MEDSFHVSGPASLNFLGGGDVKAWAKPWTQKLKIHFDKHISLGQIKTESNKPSELVVRARPFWTSSGGSCNKTDTLTPQTSPLFDVSPHTTDTESRTHWLTWKKYKLSQCSFVPFLMRFYYGFRADGFRMANLCTGRIWILWFIYFFLFSNLANSGNKIMADGWEMAASLHSKMGRSQLFHKSCGPNHILLLV